MSANDVQQLIDGDVVVSDAHQCRKRLQDFFQGIQFIHVVHRQLSTDEDRTGFSGNLGAIAINLVLHGSSTLTTKRKHARCIIVMRW